MGIESEELTRKSCNVLHGFEVPDLKSHKEDEHYCKSRCEYENGIRKTQNSVLPYCNERNSAGMTQYCKGIDYFDQCVVFALNDFN